MSNPAVIKITTGMRGPKGQTGDQGDQGIPGPNTVPTTEAVATALTEPGPAGVLSAAIGDQVAPLESDLAAIPAAIVAGAEAKVAPIRPSSGARASGVDERPILPKDFGAAGNNVSDDTTAITNAVAAAISQKRVLDLSKGHFKMTSTLDLPDGLVMRGGGQNPDNGGASRLNFSTIAAASPAITIADGSNITLSDFYITGRTAGSSPEIRVSGNSRVVSLERLTIQTATTGTGIAFAQDDTGSVIMSSIRNCIVQGAGTGYRVGKWCTSIGIEESYANNVGSYGFWLSGTYITAESSGVDNSGVYGWYIAGDNAVGVDLLACGAEKNQRTAFIVAGNANGVNLIGCRGAENNKAGLAIPSFLSVQDGADNVNVIGCDDTTPHASSTFSIGSIQGTAPTAVEVMGSRMPKGVQNLNGFGVATRNAMRLGPSIPGRASLRIPHGATPAAPVDGDVWTTTAGVFVRVNGVTKAVTLT